MPGWLANVLLKRSVRSLKYIKIYFLRGKRERENKTFIGKNGEVLWPLLKPNNKIKSFSFFIVLPGDLCRIPVVTSEGCAQSREKITS